MRILLPPHLSFFHVCRQLQFNDFWKMFGEGKHLGIDKIYEAKLAPFLTQTSLRFWNSRLWYFTQGLYYQGGMVRLPLHVLSPAEQIKRWLPRFGIASFCMLGTGLMLTLSPCLAGEGCILCSEFCKATWSRRSLREACQCTHPGAAAGRLG